MSVIDASIPIQLYVEDEKETELLNGLDLIVFVLSVDDCFNAHCVHKYIFHQIKIAQSI